MKKITYNDVQNRDDSSFEDIYIKNRKNGKIHILRCHDICDFVRIVTEVEIEHCFGTAWHCYFMDDYDEACKKAVVKHFRKEKRKENNKADD